MVALSGLVPNLKKEKKPPDCWVISHWLTGTIGPAATSGHTCSHLTVSLGFVLFLGPMLLSCFQCLFERLRKQRLSVWLLSSFSLTGAFKDRGIAVWSPVRISSPLWLMLLALELKKKKYLRLSQDHDNLLSFAVGHLYGYDLFFPLWSKFVLEKMIGNFFLLLFF